jgi:hypothetical protein
VSTEANKAIARRHVEEYWGKARVELAAELYADPHLFHGPDGRDATPSPAEAGRAVAAMHCAFSDLNFAVDDVIAEGDRVVLIWTARGRHTGEYRGIAPTGLSDERGLRGINVYRIEGGRIVERWEWFDRLGLLERMGASLRLPGQAAG